jgi:hypothetical protein
MAVLALVFALISSGCATMGLRSAVDLSVKLGEHAPPSALVYIDGQYIGTLAALAARGVRVPEGKHRLSVEKTGYFPYDAIIVSDLYPIQLDIDLLPLPE